MRALIYFFFVGLTLCCNSCISLSHFQDGKTIGENQYQYSVCLNSFGNDEVFTPPIFPEVSFTYGIFKNTDLQLTYAPFLGFYGGVKHSLLGNQPESRFALASGLKIGGYKIDKVLRFIGFPSMLNISVPLYLSFHPNEFWTFALNPNYQYIHFYSDNPVEKVSTFALAPYIEVGKRISFFIGGNVLFNYESPYTIQVGLGIRWSPR